MGGEKMTKLSSELTYCQEQESRTDCVGICIVRLYKGYIYLSLSVYLTYMLKFMVLKISFGFLFPPFCGCAVLGRPGFSVRVLTTQRSIGMNQIIPLMKRVK